MRARRASIAVVATLIVLAAPAAAFADERVEHHRKNDVFERKTAAQERVMTKQTMSATKADATEAALAVSGTKDEIGSWSAPVDWPVVGVHAGLLPNGKVIAYDSVGDSATENYQVHDHTRATVWDPQTGAHSDVRLDGFNIFCSGLSHMLDGSMFFAGGNKDHHLAGLRETHIFKPDSNAWSRGIDMALERWYPTVTGLPDGEMLITEGGPDTPEVRQRDGTMRRLTTAVLDLPLYPWLDVAPDGRTFYSGPDQTMRKIDPSGTGAWQSYTQRDAINRTYGGHALFDIGKILVAGGGGSVRDSRVIDINGAGPKVSTTGSMAFGRRQNNLTLLADGTALATGGNSSGAELVDLNNGVYNAELWNPATGQWKTLAAQQATRQYHSAALLLSDGRVLSAGGGLCDRCDAVGYLAKNAEVFTPPYLYKKDGSGQLAPRPSITTAPATIDFGTRFAVSTPDAGSIAKVGLVRPGAVTHSVDMDQRYVPLSFSAGADSLTVNAPPNANVAPPGPYMLFIVDAAGVPSMAKMVTVPPVGKAPAEDKALNKVATASSVEASWLGPEKANDGNSSTRWSSEYADNQWWQVDLGSMRDVDAVELNWEAAYARTYKIQTSVDGATFTDVASVTLDSAGLKRTTFSMVSARYVRVLGLTRATPYGFSFWDARVFGPTDGTTQPPPPPPPPPPEDVALNKAASASSVFSKGYTAEKGNDGDSATRWMSAKQDNEWWQVDLGAAKTIDTVEINWSPDYGKTYKIQVSSDGASFADVASVSIGAEGVKRTTFAAVKARYVRVLGLTRATRKGFSFWDARVFAAVA